MKILGIDYGTKRIGLAISDETQTLAREYDILSPADFWSSIEQIVSQEGVGKIVLGLPIGMSGQETAKTHEVADFQLQLTSRLSVPIELIDERLSSVMAEHIVGKNNHIDSLAAQIFLQNYLDSHK